MSINIFTKLNKLLSFHHLNHAWTKHEHAWTNTLPQSLELTISWEPFLLLEGPAERTAYFRRFHLCKYKGLRVLKFPSCKDPSGNAWSNSDFQALEPGAEGVFIRVDVWILKTCSGFNQLKFSLRDYCIPDSILVVGNRAVLLSATNLLVGETDYQQTLL